MGKTWKKLAASGMVLVLAGSFAVTAIADEKKITSWDQIHNMNGFTFNLMKVAKYLKEYDYCVKIGNIFFTRIYIF